MTPHLHFYAYAECLHRNDSKTKTLYNYLRAFVEPELPNLMAKFDMLEPLPQAEQKRRLGEENFNDMRYSGLFCLYEGNSLLSVIVLEKKVRLDRIITMPKYRRQGHALRLLTELTRQMIHHGCPVLISPVYPRIASLFEKAGWVRLESGTKTTIDYCPPQMKHLYDGTTSHEGSAEWNQLNHRNWGTYLLFHQLHLFKKNQPNGEMNDAMVSAMSVIDFDSPSQS